MCSHKPPLLKLHNKAKRPFKNHLKKTVLKSPSIKSTLTTIFHNLNHHNNKMCSHNNHYTNLIITHILHLKTILCSKSNQNLTI